MVANVTRSSVLMVHITRCRKTKHGCNITRSQGRQLCGSNRISGQFAEIVGLTGRKMTVMDGYTSLDDSIRFEQHSLRYGHADLVRCFEIHDQLELGWLFDG